VTIFANVNFIMYRLTLFVQLNKSVPAQRNVY